MKNIKVINISSIIPNQYSGAGLAAYRKSDRDWNVGILHSLITITPKNELINARFPIFSFRRSNEKWKQIFWSAYLISIFLISNRNKYHVIHTFSTTWEGLFAILIGKLLGKKCVVEITRLDGDDPLHIEKKDKFKITYYRRRIQFICANAIVGLSPVLTETAHKAGFSDSKIFLIPRSVQVDRFNVPSIDLKWSIRKKLGLNKEEKIILFVGSLLKRKGAELLPGIIAGLVKAKKWPIKLIIIGNGDVNQEEIELTKSIQNEIEKLNISDFVIMGGVVTNVIDYMQVSDLLLFPSKKEGIPNVVLESMSCGLPVVCNKIDGITDFIFDSIPSFQISGDDINAYINAISTLLADDNLYNQISNLNRQQILQKFTPAVIDAKYQMMYERVFA